MPEPLSAPWPQTSSSEPICFPEWGWSTQRKPPSTAMNINFGRRYSDPIVAPCRNYKEFAIIHHRINHQNAETKTIDNVRCRRWTKPVLPERQNDQPGWPCRWRCLGIPWRHCLPRASLVCAPPAYWGACLLPRNPWAHLTSPPNHSSEAKALTARVMN